MSGSQLWFPLTSADHVRPVFATSERMERASVTRDALADDFGIGVNKNAHDGIVSNES